MASSETPVKCPSCNEELERDDEDGQYPESCPDCGEDIPAKSFEPVLVCPSCGKKRTKKKKGEGYAKFCTNRTCKYNFETGQQTNEATIAATTTAVTVATTTAPTNATNTVPTNAIAAAPSTATTAGTTVGTTAVTNTMSQFSHHAESLASNLQSSPITNLADTKDYSTEGQIVPTQWSPNSESAVRGSENERDETEEERQFGSKANPSSQANPTGLLTRPMQNPTPSVPEDFGNEEEYVLVSDTESQSKPDIYEEFVGWKARLTDIKGMMDSYPRLLTSAESNAVQSGLKKIDSLPASYARALKQTPKSTKGKIRRKSMEEKNKVLDQMQTMVNMWKRPKSLIDEALHKFSDQLRAIQKQSSLTPKSQCRKVTFWAFLSKDSKVKNKTEDCEPVIEVRSNHGNFRWTEGDPLAILREGNAGVWSGETFSIARQHKTLEYKYALRSSKSKLIWESLFQDNNRTFDFSKEVPLMVTTTGMPPLNTTDKDRNLL